jgi:hypothetical protein
MNSLVESGQLTRHSFLEVLSGTLGALTPPGTEAWGRRLDLPRFSEALFDGKGALRGDELLELFASRAPDAATHRLIRRALAIQSLRGLTPEAQERVDAHAVVRDLSLEDPELAPSVFKTPFGFVAVRLFASEIDKNHIRELLRIHVWPAGKRPKIQSLETTIHSHELAARSWILDGKIANTTYAVEPAGEARTQQTLYTIQRDRYAKSSLQNTGTSVRVGVESERIYSRGGTYEVALGAYHQTDVPLEDYTATLFYFGSRPGWQQSFTVGPASGLQFETHHVQGYDGPATSSVLSELRERVS